MAHFVTPIYIIHHPSGFEAEVLAYRLDAPFNQQIDKHLKTHYFNG